MVLHLSKIFQRKKNYIKIIVVCAATIIAKGCEFDMSYTLFYINFCSYIIQNMMLGLIFEGCLLFSSITVTK